MAASKTQRKAARAKPARPMRAKPATPLRLKPAKSARTRPAKPAVARLANTIGVKTTRDTILDAAEELFARSGPTAVSIRAIATKAGVNLAAVNYHFYTKERLFEEMYRRRIIPVNEERLAMLEACLERPSLEKIVEAFVAPMIRLIEGASPGTRAAVVMQFVARFVSVPGEGRYLDVYFEPVRSRFFAALREVIPELPVTDLLWRYNCMVGAVNYALGGSDRMTRLPKDFAGMQLERSGSVSEAVQRVVSFVIAGFSAPPIVLKPQR
jgi:AcrR family transcriptional regulator